MQAQSNRRRGGAPLRSRRQLVTYGASLHKTLAAAEQLAADGIEAEVIDLRALRPLDDATILASVARTRRALIVDEGWRAGGISAEIGARIAEQAFYDLDAPVARLCGAEVPIPYPKHLEDAAVPQIDTIVRRRCPSRDRHERLPHAVARRRHGRRDSRRVVSRGPATALCAAISWPWSRHRRARSRSRSSRKASSNAGSSSRAPRCRSGRRWR